MLLHPDVAGAAQTDPAGQSASDVQGPVVAGVDTQTGGAAGQRVREQKGVLPGAIQSPQLPPHGLSHGIPPLAQLGAVVDVVDVDVVVVLVVVLVVVSPGGHAIPFAAARGYC